ncbi:MAG: class I SAM-dependent methyltransferase [Rhodospirillaceae bacterium]
MENKPRPKTEKRDKSAWEERSKIWAQTTVQGKSQDDTLNQIIIAEAGVKPGHQLLDLASGSGNPAISAALRMNGSGTITLTDLTLGMLQNARTRALNLDLKNLHYCTADMNNLPFGDGIFDVITCRFGLMFPVNKVAAVTESLRVLKPGGRIAYMVWDAYEKNPPFFIPRRTVSQFFGEKEPPVPARHAMSKPGTLETILKAAGYADVIEKEVSYNNEVTDLETYVSNGLKRSHADTLDKLSEDNVRRLKTSLFQAWSPYTKGGITYVPNCARIGTGSKPS